VVKIKHELFQSEDKVSGRYAGGCNPLDRTCNFGCKEQVWLLTGRFGIYHQGGFFVGWLGPREFEASAENESFWLSTRFFGGVFKNRIFPAFSVYASTACGSSDSNSGGGGGGGRIFEK
jgi:hypothetical protein